jgi:hypothetical protein
MPNEGREPRILKGTEVLPPMEEAPSAAPAPQKRGAGKPKGRAAERGRIAGRFRSINLFLDATARTLTPAQALVWVILWRDTKREGTARTSYADLARRAGVSLSTVKRAVGVLTERGLATVVYRGSLRRGASVYRLDSLLKEAGQRQPLVSP